MELIEEIRTIYDNYPALTTQILAASVRTGNHVSLQPWLAPMSPRCRLRF